MSSSRAATALCFFACAFLALNMIVGIHNPSVGIVIYLGLSAIAAYIFGWYVLRDSRETIRLWKETIQEWEKTNDLLRDNVESKAQTREIALDAIQELAYSEPEKARELVGRMSELVMQDVARTLPLMEDDTREHVNGIVEDLQVLQANLHKQGVENE